MFGDEATIVIVLTKLSGFSLSDVRINSCDSVDGSKTHLSSLNYIELTAIMVT